MRANEKDCRNALLATIRPPQKPSHHQRVGQLLPNSVFFMRAALAASDAKFDNLTASLAASAAIRVASAA